MIAAFCWVCMVAMVITALLALRERDTKCSALVMIAEWAVRGLMRLGCCLMAAAYTVDTLGRRMWEVLAEVPAYFVSEYRSHSPRFEFGSRERV